MEQLVRHFLIETGPRGVKIKGCQNEPHFGKQHSMTKSITKKKRTNTTVMNILGIYTTLGGMCSTTCMGGPLKSIILINI